MNSYSKFHVWLMCLSLICFLGCGRVEVTSGSETTNNLSGRLVLEDGSAAVGAIVELSALPEDSLPISLAKISETGITNSNGFFTFEDMADGMYMLKAYLEEEQTDDIFLVYDFDIQLQSDLDVGAMTLLKPGNITVRIFSDSTPINDVECFIPGTIFEAVSDDSGLCHFPEVTPEEYTVLFAHSQFVSDSISGIIVLAEENKLLEDITLMPDPNSPSTPRPRDNAENMALPLVLSWKPVLAEGANTALYDIYLRNDDGSSEFLLISQEQTDTLLVLDYLKGNQAYLWKVIAHVGGETREGSEWRFSTAPDTVAPAITLIGSNPMEVEQDSAFKDPGYVCNDNWDGEISISPVSNVNTNLVGNYEIVYDCRDSAGNNAATATRIVNVVSSTNVGTVTPVERVLLFEKSPTHLLSRQALRAALEELAAEHGFQLDATEDQNVFVLDNLQQYQMVIWSCNDGNDVVPPGPLQEDFQTYVEGGGGFLAVHAAGAYIQNWEWFHAQIVQPYWRLDPSGTVARVLVESGIESNPATTIFTEGLPDEVVMSDEWFTFRGNPRNINQAFEDNPDINPDYIPSEVTIILTLDEESFNPVRPIGDHPIAWAHRAGKGKVVYNAIGHDPDVYTQNGGFCKTLTWNMMRYVSGNYSE